MSNKQTNKNSCCFIRPQTQYLYMCDALLHLATLCLHSFQTFASNYYASKQLIQQLQMLTGTVCISQ